MNFDGMTDNQVMALFYAGNDDAFTEIWTRWHVRIWAFLRRMVPAAAEDLTQETFLRVYGSRLSPYNPAQPFPPWLFQVARRVALDALRRLRHQPTTALPEDAGEEPHRRSTEEFEADIDDCLQTLDDEEREFCLLWEDAFGELKQTEIAQLWGRRNGHVSKVKTRALDKMRDCLAEKGYDL